MRARSPPVRADQFSLTDSIGDAPGPVSPGRQKIKHGLLVRRRLLRIKRPNAHGLQCRGVRISIEPGLRTEEQQVMRQSLGHHLTTACQRVYSSGCVTPPLGIDVLDNQSRPRASKKPAAAARTRSPAAASGRRLRLMTAVRRPRGQQDAQDLEYALISRWRTSGS